MANPLQWIQAHKAAAGVGAVAAVGGLALYKRSHPSSSTAAAVPAGATTGGTVSGSAGFDSSGLDEFDQLAAAISNINDEIGALSTQTNPIAPLNNQHITNPASLQKPTNPVSPGPPPAASPGYQTINIKGQEYAVLGTETGGYFTGYNVGGGAPVYFGNANQIAQGLPTGSGTEDVYTPIGYSGLISSAKVSHKKLGG